MIELGFITNRVASPDKSPSLWVFACSFSRSLATLSLSPSDHSTFR